MASPSSLPIGYYGRFGGRFVAETLVPALDEGVKVKTVQRSVSRLKLQLHAAWITAAAAVLL